MVVEFFGLDAGSATLAIALRAVGGDENGILPLGDINSRTLPSWLGESSV
jgi:hypothetical protein